MTKPEWFTKAPMHVKVSILFLAGCVVGAIISGILVAPLVMLIVGLCISIVVALLSIIIHYDEDNSWW